MSNDYLNHLEPIVTEDVVGLRKAQNSYGDSWKRRGGVGAFMMLARKWDRLENHVMVRRSRGTVAESKSADKYDIFAHIELDTRAEGILDDIRDLRRYLILVEAEMRARTTLPEHRDNVPSSTRIRVIDAERPE